MLWGLSLWGRFTLLEHLFHSVFHSLCHQCRRKSPGALRAEAQGTLQGSQYLPSMAGAGNSGTRFASMAAFPRCSRMASLPQRCLTASSSDCQCAKVQSCQVLGIHIWRPISLATATLAAVTEGSVKANHSKYRSSAQAIGNRLKKGHQITYTWI